MTQNRIKDLLIQLGLSAPDSFTQIFDRVRDREDIAVLRCNQSGAILLSRTDHMEIGHYQEKEVLSYYNADSVQSAALKTEIDDSRREQMFKDLVRNKSLVDVGCGAGGSLKKLSAYAKSAVGVEPQRLARSLAENLGLNIKADINDVPEGSCDVATLFHVYEHITDPIEFLKLVRKRLRPGGKILIEVPHSGDFLISFLANEAFMKHTFWSEHIILHSRVTLERFAKEAGFVNPVIRGYQRYPLANHLHWLANGKPGGHLNWSFLRDEQLDAAYTSVLANLNLTDTIILEASNPL
ncbi:MAG: class I SAM-dependent methyltransferase [Prosthecobacter sp.]|uniref:class I SAM-dependent methyltransferase n=1 Tax=Prosthecobacter sp. TaxID=1965333 RepID=UPI0019E66847|nr:class I SAM-dependent methyltransferase [Prosthecobacter sp.]MBE2285063.1 class I SAM-dependent methyltransferase [Prosthecobacter sp.]